MSTLLDAKPPVHQEIDPEFMIPGQADLSLFCCPNKECPDHKKLGQGNVQLYIRYGRKEVRLFECTTCGKTFSELTGTPFWDSRLGFQTITTIYSELLRGIPIRAVARGDMRIVDPSPVSKNTVKRFLRLGKANPKYVKAFLRYHGVSCSDEAFETQVVSRAR